VQAGIQDHYDQFLKVVGWLTTLIALILLGVTLVLHLDYSPFKHPGAPASPDRLDILKLDMVRWLLTTIAGSICGMRHAPRRRSRFDSGPGSSVAVPLAALLGVVVIAGGATVCWFYWMMGIPGGDRMRNLLLAGGYFAIPAALLLTFVVSLFTPAAK
jgi:hypothetical protein